MSGVATLFLDTNVLVYARDRSEPVKGPRAQDLLDKIFQAGPPLISVQVLSEFFWTVTRKLPIPLTPQEARHWSKITVPISITRSRGVLSTCNSNQRRLVLLEPHLLQFLIRHFDPLLSILWVSRPPPRTCKPVRVRVLPIRLTTTAWLTREAPPPVLRDVAEHPMLNCVPLARPRRGSDKRRSMYTISSLRQRARIPSTTDCGSRCSRHRRP